MLFSNVHSDSYSGPLKSAGEFFIKAVASSSPVNIAGGKKLTIEQPVQRIGTATSMARSDRRRSGAAVGAQRRL